MNQTIDHFIPKIIGGTNDKRNLVPLCKECNKAKMGSQVDPKEYYPYLPEEYVIQCTKYKKSLYKFDETNYGLLKDYIGIENWSEYESVKR